MPALPGVPLTAIPATTAPNADLPATQFPSLTRIAVTEKVGPPVANRQHKSLEKRDETLRTLVNSLIAAVNAVDANYLRLDGSNTLAHDIPAGGHTFTGLRDAAANDEPVTLGQLGGTSSSLAAEIAARIAGDNALNSSKAPLASPALTGSPTAPTQTVHDSTTKLATTAFVVAEIAATTPPSGEALLTGSGNFTVPDKVFLIEALTVGAGAGGGRSTDGSSSPNSSVNGGGGGRGGVCRRKIPVTPGQVIAYSGGSGGAGQGNSGTPAAQAGTASTFGSLTAPGGLAASGGLSGANGADDLSYNPPTGKYTYATQVSPNTTPPPDPLDTAGATGTATRRPGSKGGGYFERKVTTTGMAPQVIGKGVEGPLVDNGGYFGGPINNTLPRSPGTGAGNDGGLGCGGSGASSADAASPGGAGGDGFTYVTWGL